MGKWEMVQLADVLTDTITGEWGNECINGDGVNVIRTTNFTNKGIVDFSNVIVRDISAEKVKRKKLLPHDIILEKSGGSDNQPVGRVVYFDNSDDIFLCNNFTQILRINPQAAHSKYVFYNLFNLHRTGITELLQNKTTGIRNLQVKSYMALTIPLPPLPVQQKIADILDCANALMEKRKAQIEKLDLLVKSQFVEMFGDPNKFEQLSVEDVCKKIMGGGTPNKSKPEYYMGNIPWVTPKDMKTNFIADSIDHITEEATKNSSAKIIPVNSVLMVIRSGILKHSLPVAINVAPVAINQDMKAFLVNDKVIAEFLMYTFDARKAELLSNVRAVTADNIEFGIIRSLKISVPPIALQTQFATLVERVETQKAQLKMSLALLELNYKSLMQKCFKGEIFNE